MTVTIEEIRHPKWIKIEEKYPISYNADDRYLKCENYPRSYRGGGFKQPGYNPNHNILEVERVNINSDNLQFRGN